MDVLKDEGVAYAQALARDGCSVTLRGFQRVPHGFMSMRLLYPTIQRQGVAELVQFLRFWDTTALG